MNFIIRQAEAKDAEGIGQLAEEFIDFLHSIGDEAEQNAIGFVAE